jgi:uncharacterized protein (DUF2062 family)
MRKLSAAIRSALCGGTHPWHVAAAVLLGVLAAFLMGINLLLAAVLLLALVLNVRTRAWFAGHAAGLLVAWVLTPLTWHVGYLLLERTPLAGALADSSEGLSVVLLDLDRYTLVGGLVVGSAVAVLMAWLTGRFVRVSNASAEARAGLMWPWEAGGSGRASWSSTCCGGWPL